ncbi:MAG: hypothetical protein RLT05_30980 [Bauldia litoralis]
MAKNFSLEGYRELVDDLLGRGYRVVGFDEAIPGKPHLILRHDIDMSIQAAVEMAEVEGSLGVSAHYFVLLRSEMYNPWAPANIGDLSRIAALGHAIGLHFDASLYNSDEDLEAAAVAECEALEAMTGRDVSAISFHRPAPSLQGRAGRFAGRHHAYEPRFFREMGYCSDSRGGWHHGEPLAQEAVLAGRALQLLTHPIWWVGADGAGPVRVLDGFRRNRDRVLAAELARNCEPYRVARGATPGPLDELKEA